jgi:hypothetical protein
MNNNISLISVLKITPKRKRLPTAPAPLRALLKSNKHLHHLRVAFKDSLSIPLVQNDRRTIGEIYLAHLSTLPLGIARRFAFANVQLYIGMEF